MRLVREIDPVAVNSFINDPDIRSWVGEGKDPLDATLILGNPQNIILTSEDQGMIMFLYVTPGIYEVQPHVRRSARGVWAIEFCREATHYMACGSDAWEVIGGIPKHNVASIAMSRAIGMVREFERPGVCAMNGRVTDNVYVRLTFQDWCVKYGHRYEPAGWDFLQKIEKQAGIRIPTDDNKARYVGIAAAMLALGKPEKAVTAYNRWAMVTRQPVGRLISKSPLRIGLGDLVIQFAGPGEFSVVPQMELGRCP